MFCICSLLGVLWCLKIVCHLPSGSDGRVCLQCKRPRFNRWVRKIPWRRQWQPIPVFLPGKFHGRRSPGDCSPWGHRKTGLSDFHIHMFSVSRLSSFCGSAGKESCLPCRRLGSVPGLGRSPGEGKGYPLQYSGLENSMDCIVHGLAKSQTWLTFTFTLCMVWNVFYLRWFTWDCPAFPTQLAEDTFLHSIFFLLCQRWVVHRCYVFISGLSFHWFLCLSLCQHQAVLITVAL